MSEFSERYSSAEAHLRDALVAFRTSHTQKHLSVKGVDWSYYDIGHGEQVILWLVGGLRMADAAFRSIPMMQDSFRIIAPDYPLVTTMVELADGLAAILKEENLKSCEVLSGSFGGMLAQVFVRQYPKRVSKLILSTTTAPNPELAQRYQQELAVIQELPDEIVREGAKIRFYDMVNPPQSESNFWKAYLDELFSVRLNKQDILSTYYCLLDYVSNYHFEPQDLDNWHGEILILDSDDDNVFEASSRQTVNNLYPQAHTHTFSNAGHSPASTQRDIYFEIVRKFLHE